MEQLTAPIDRDTRQCATLESDTHLLRSRTSNGQQISGAYDHLTQVLGFAYLAQTCALNSLSQE